MTSYGALIRTPRIARLYVSMTVARLPIGIDSIATVLFLRHQGKSFALAGAAAGALALGSAAGAPFIGRLIDRLSAHVLVWVALGHAAGLVAMVLLALASAPPPLVVLCAFLAGATLPTVASVLRGAYSTLLAHERSLIPSAFALEAVITESIFVIGPLVTALLTAVGSPAAALVLSALIVVGGTTWFVAELPPAIADHRAEHDEHRHWAGALRSPGLRTIVMAMLPVGFAFGAVEVTMPAFADAQGQRQFAGVLIAVWAIGSAVGGAIYGARPRMLPLRRMHLLVASLLPVVMAALALAWSPLSMVVLVAIAGLPIAPLIATRNELAAVVAIPGYETETFTWPLTSLVSGAALGAAVAGALADGAGWRTSIAAATAAALFGAAVSVSRRSTLRPAHAEVGVT